MSAEKTIGKDIEKLFESSAGETALYLSIIAILVADILPTPDDSAYFLLTRKLRNQFYNNEITPKQYWERNTILYYGLNVIWWGIVLTIVASIKGTTMDKMKWGGALLGAGAVVVVIHNNIIKDEKMKEEEEFNRIISGRETKSGMDGVIKIENNSVLNYKQFRIR